ncbi:putative NAD dependent epimerase/dehydratase [Lasiosphaeria hispida]|uniref:NAD dependent epimerase/dehydratase n=1 Tax=Lasiosphaeria hispida TaxID=260671 RepID=A0AAJ0HCW6_9PEZI|nr:putative NAD dependent epimerase/dehydratase [Lasiosphaeria hispida]
MAEPETTIPKGSLVLVTGATGSLATHVIKAFLERGYKVRGTVRDLAKASWLVDDLFKTYADRGDFELAVVRTLADQNAFDEVVKGVSAIAHVASIVTFDSDPNKVIPQTVLGATSILEAALKEPSVREFVYTSSIAAAVMPMLGNSVHVTKDTFNDTAVQLAWAVPTSGGVVYMASKTEAEKAVWRFVEDKKPHFTVNSVGPSSIIGQPLHKSHVDSAGAWLKQLYDGDRVALTSTPAMYTVDVKDAAQLHVAAVVDPEVKNERLQAWASNTNWNGLLAIMRRQYPDRKFIDDLPGLGELSVTSDFTQPLGLLKKWAGQDGWKSLEETVADNMDGILAFSP